MKATRGRSDDRIGISREEGVGGKNVGVRRRTKACVCVLE
jgi:hypothetical protein